MWSAALTCGHTRIAYNSCRNRHCPKCQWSAAERWLAAREAELLPVPYYHVVFTLPIIAYQNKAKVYWAASLPQPRRSPPSRPIPSLSVRRSASLLSCIPGDRTSIIIHIVHCIVPGGGISPAGKRWIPCQPEDYRENGRSKQKVMRLAIGEFR